MKIIKAANGKQRVSLNKNEWIDLGKKAGWLEKESQNLMRPIELNTKLKINPANNNAYLFIPELRKEVFLGNIPEIDQIVKEFKMRAQGYF